MRPDTRTQLSLFRESDLFALAIRTGDAKDWSDPRSSERALACLALALGAASSQKLSKEEAEIANGYAFPDRFVWEIGDRIRSGQDPLGEVFTRIRSVKERRAAGAVYTPAPIVESMFDAVEAVGTPTRVVEPGSGSARFLMEAARRFPNAQLLAIENEPLAALMARANLAALGKTNQSRVVVSDFRHVDIEATEGATLYIGNPPYVRHHLIPADAKEWLRIAARKLGLEASALAGLHVYFFLSIVRWARPGDFGALITAAEWLDVNYGKLVRDLFLGRLGGQSVSLIDSSLSPFPGTATTAAITTFVVGTRPPAARFSRIKDLEMIDPCNAGRQIPRDRLASEKRWSHFTRETKQFPEGFIELGELFRVHRGQVTGANKVWIESARSKGLPGDVLFPAVTRAHELIRAGLTLSKSDSLRRVIDLPVDLSQFAGESRSAIDRFLCWAELAGAPKGYVARHRKAWWAVGLRDPAPILATYMARRPPSFVLNEAHARHINIAHGLYPREKLSKATLTSLVRFLRESATTCGGRVYAGGLTKFEPREMERIPIPEPSVLAEMCS